MNQRELLIELAKLKNEPKGVSWKDKVILDKLIKQLQKKTLPQSMIDKLTDVYREVKNEFQKNKNGGKK